MSKGINWTFIIWIFLSITLSVGSIWLPEPKWSAQNLANVVSFFAIIAGSLFAVTAILCDPSFMTRSRWDKALEEAKVVQGSLSYFYFLYVLYLVVIVLAVALGFVGTEHSEKLSNPTKVIYLFKILSRSLIVLGVFCTTMSFAVPFLLLRHQRRRLVKQVRAQTALEDQ